MARRIVAIVLGLMSGVVIMLGFEFASMTLFPAPADLATFSATQFADYVQQLPIGAFLLVLAGWFFGAVDAAILAAWLAPNRPLLHAAIVSTVLLVMALANLIMIPHPFWMVIATPFIYIAAFFIGGTTGKRLHARRYTTTSTASG